MPSPSILVVTVTISPAKATVVRQCAGMNSVAEGSCMQLFISFAKEDWSLIISGYIQAVSENFIAVRDKVPYALFCEDAFHRAFFQWESAVVHKLAY